MGPGEHGRPGKSDNWHRMASNSLEASQWSHMSHTKQQWLYAAEYALQDLTTQLYAKGRWVRSCGTAIRRGRMEGTTDRWTVQPNKWVVSNQCSSDQGRQSPCCMDKLHHNWCASHGNTGSIPRGATGRLVNEKKAKHMDADLIWWM